MSVVSENQTSDGVQVFVLENSPQPLPHAGFYFSVFAALKTTRQLHSHAYTLQLWIIASISQSISQ